MKEKVYIVSCCLDANRKVIMRVFKNLEDAERYKRILDTYYTYKMEILEMELE